MANIQTLKRVPSTIRLASTINKDESIPSKKLKEISPLTEPCLRLTPQERKREIKKALKQLEPTSRAPKEDALRKIIDLNAVEASLQLLNFLVSEVVMLCRAQNKLWSLHSEQIRKGGSLADLDYSPEAKELRKQIKLHTSLYALSLEAVVKLHLKEAVPTLGKLLRLTSSPLINDLFDAMISLDSKRGATYIRKELSKQKCYCIEEGINALVKASANDEKTISLLINFLLLGEYEISRKAAFALGKLHAIECIPKLERKLPLVSSYTAKHGILLALKALNAKQSAPEIAKCLSDPDAHIRKTAADALLELESYNLIPKLVSRLKTTKNRNEKQGLVLALGNFRATEAFSEIEALASSNDSDLKDAALSAVAQIKTKKSAQILLDKLTQVTARIKFYKNNPNHSIFTEEREQYGLIYTLGENKVKEAVPVLMGFLSSPNEATCHKAIRAIAQIGAGEALPKIIELFEQETNKGKGASTDITKAAISAFPKLNAVDQLPKLIQLLGNSDYSAEADNALAEFGYALVLEQMPKIENSELREKCIYHFLRHTSSSDLSAVVSGLIKCLIWERNPAVISSLNHVIEELSKKGVNE
ncbi:MAG: HEAT repeat domain-containing protein [Candidatus Micrarchaeota archaeon]